MKASARARGDRDHVDGMPRRDLVQLAARAMIDANEDAVLWAIVHARGGFETFRPIARALFARDGAPRFTDTELAGIYFFIEQHVATLTLQAPPPTPAPDPADAPVTIEVDTRPPTVH